MLKIYEGNVNLRINDRSCNTVFGIRDNKVIHVKELNQKLDRGLYNEWNNYKFDKNKLKFGKVSLN